MNENDITDDYPWQFNFESSDIVRDEVKEKYSENYVVYRDFLTTHSQIPLKTGSVITMSMGYKIYKSVDYTRPTWNGYVEDMEWALLEIAASTSLAAGLALSALLALNL